VLHSISLADDLVIGRARSEDRIDIDAEPWLGRVVVPDEHNLVLQAAGLMRTRAHGTPLEVALHKRIPLGAGLGGGSANAAGALEALNELWEAGLEPAALGSLGAALGSDVPFCLVGGTAVATGRGEIVTPLAAPARLTFVLGLSARPLGTAEVYGAHDPAASPPAVDPLLAALAAADALRIAALLHNDLEPAAFRLRPELVEAKQALLGAGALGAALSGSGPTLFAVTHDERHAREVAAAVEGHFDRVEVVSSRPTCIQWLEGPRVAEARGGAGGGIYAEFRSDYPFASSDLQSSALPPR
jgi:4-diphosphocytidyl-2-C-methyl-D-erythritol kinase